MSNASPNLNVSGAPSAPAQHLGAGNFFGAIHGRREQCAAIFTEVRHSSPPKHSPTSVSAAASPTKATSRAPSAKSQA